MQKLLEMLAQRASVLLIIGGALITIVGAANGFTVSSFSIAFPDLWGRYVALAVGSGLLVLGILFEIAERRNRSQRSDSAGMTNGGFSIGPDFEEPTRISFPDLVRISSAFLKEDQCTVLLWAYIPPKGERLRQIIDQQSRYLLAHQTGTWNAQKRQWHNLFSLRFFVSEQWQVAISNNEADGLVIPLSQEDDLTTGWHHFQITWDKPKQELVVLIDGILRNREISFARYWPETISNTVTVGAFSIAGADYRNSYCETYLYQLVITPHWHTPSDRMAQEHRMRKPPMP